MNCSYVFKGYDNTFKLLSSRFYVKPGFSVTPRFCVLTPLFPFLFKFAEILLIYLMKILMIDFHLENPREYPGLALINFWSSL